MKQTTIWINSELHRDLKLEAVRRGGTIRALAEEAIEAYLNRVRTNPKREQEARDEMGEKTDGPPE